MNIAILIISSISLCILIFIIYKQKGTMADLSQLTQEVNENSDVIQSAVILLNGLKAALDAAGTDPVALAALSAQLDTQSNALAAAVAANTIPVGE